MWALCEFWKVLRRELPPRCALVGAPVLALLGASTAFAQADETTTRGFAIPETRDARALAERARTHIDAQRWSEAIDALQQLIDTHGGEVLHPPNESTRNSARDGTADVRVGAADWARTQLTQLGDDARKLYAARYGVEAQERVADGLRARNRRGLLEVTRRFPLTLGARDAWWALGDLELELGHFAAAESAFTRASELDIALELPPTPSGAARRELVASLNVGTAAAPVRTLPGADGVQWQQPLLREEESPFAIGQWNNVFPCVQGDTVVVSDALKVWAFDAWSGEQRWETNEPLGWKQVDRGEYRPNGTSALRRRDFFKSLEWRSLMIRPATSAGVVVTALQVPFSRVYNENFQQYSITSVIPERRLYAYDLETGRELWNHRPPMLWDGESGPLEQRMSVAAPPVIVGSRVIAPIYRMQGRVDLHIGCFDLFTGERLWSTAVISGQIALNMFGRQFREYSAAPVTVVDDRVLLLTQLGALAAIDLHSGDLLWESMYDSVPVPRASHYEQREREQVWGNASPMVVGDVVVATPLDSYELIGFDLRTGRRLWSRPHLTFRRLPREIMTLIGASEDRVWVAGTRVQSLRAPLGLASLQAPTELSEGADLVNVDRAPRPLLTDRHVLLATPTRRIALDRNALKNEDRRASAEWVDGSRTPGNIVAVDGATFFATPTMITASIDWRAVEERQRQRAEADPDNASIALEWATILERRGWAELDAARIDSALRLFADARGKIERFLTPDGDGAGREPGQRLFSLLMSEARAFEIAADPKNALARIELALPLAPSATEACRALVRQIDLLEIEGEFQRRSASLVELERVAFDLMMPDEWWLRRGRVLYQASLPKSGNLERLPVSLFVGIEHALDARRAGEPALELEHLHATLASWGDVALPTRPPLAISERIAEMIDAGEPAYAAFEARAADMLATARASQDLAALERLPSLFPHSQAALEASRARLESALASREFARVVTGVQATIPDDWSILDAREREVQALLVLRAALLDLGNRDLAARLTTRLAADHGDIVSTLARDASRTIAELAQLDPQVVDSATSAVEASYDAHSSEVRTFSGATVLLGAFAAPTEQDPQRALQVVCQKGARNDVVQAFAPQQPFQPVWSQPLEQSSVQDGWSAERSGESLVIGGRSALIGLSLVDGEFSWRWSAGPTRIEWFHAGEGLALVGTRTSDGRATLVAVETSGGLELWARAVPAGLWAKPVYGDQHVVLLPSDWAASPALVLDPLTGSRTTTIALSGHVGEADASGAWIEGNRLIIPSFPKSSAALERDCLAAFDLGTGQRVWRVPCEGDREFDSIVRSGDDAYMIHLAVGRVSGGVGGVVLQLNTRIGAVRRLQSVSIAADDVLIGVPRQSVTRLDGPYLFLRSPAKDSQSTQITAVQLPYGKSWTYKLPVPPAQFYNSGPMPMPALSEGHAALVYTETPRLRGQVNVPQTTLLVLDRENGFMRVTEALPSALGTADTLSLAVLGPTLWIAGGGALQVRTKP